MTPIEIRPRFQTHLPASPQAIIDSLQATVMRYQGQVESSTVDYYMVLRIPVEQQHYWSPQLSLTLETDEAQGGTLIRGLYGPRPSVWLMFMFMYSSVGVIGLFIAITGFSQYSLGVAAPVLWALPVLAGIALALYFAAKAGERLGRQEMDRLRAYFDEALKLVQQQAH